MSASLLLPLSFFFSNRPRHCCTSEALHDHRFASAFSATVCTLVSPYLSVPAAALSPPLSLLLHAWLDRSCNRRRQSLHPNLAAQCPSAPIKGSLKCPIFPSLHSLGSSCLSPLILTVFQVLVAVGCHSFHRCFTAIDDAHRCLLHHQHSLLAVYPSLSSPWQELCRNHRATIDPLHAAAKPLVAGDFFVP